MAQSGYTPISLYYSTTAAATPTAGNLTDGELAINITDGVLYYKNSSGTVVSLTSSSGGITWQSVQTANFTATAGNAYPINTTSAAVTVTLPASPTAGQLIGLLDYAGTFATNNVVVNPNGNNLNGATSSVKLDQNNEGITFVYSGATQGWVSYSSYKAITPPSAFSVNYLIVAGGGGGGVYGGGGGAGGLISGSGLSVDKTSTYTVTVGSGGSGSSSRATVGGSGGNSSFSAYGTAAVGGGGGASDNNSTGMSGGNGGSGGGAAYAAATSVGTGTSGQGYAGGTAIYAGTGYPGGGGGGSGAVGGNASSSTAAGNGGVGVSNSISGTATYYAGGGGGGVQLSGTRGTGGTGGGGTGGNASNSATSGTVNLGGGGGGDGSGSSGGSGGSGTVIVSYADTVQQMAGGTVTSSGGNIIHTFNSSGYLTPLTYVGNSLRTRASNSAYLSRTPASNLSRQIFTYSAWVKRGSLGSFSNLLSTFPSGTVEATIAFTSSDTFQVSDYNSADNILLVTSQVFRDPAAWYHIVVAFDTTQATSTNRVKIYVNGSQVTAFGTSIYPTQNYNMNFLQTGSASAINARGRTFVQNFDGEITNVQLIDGQALTPNSFGSFNLYGVWQPISYGGTYGTNGFYLKFNNTTSTTTLGYDTSGNSNNWTCNNISLTAGSTYDAMTDSPTLTSETAANYATLNPLNSYNATLTNGNLNILFTDPSSSRTTFATMAVTSGKFYWEMSVIAGGGGYYPGIGVNTNLALPPTAQSGDTATGFMYLSTGQKLNNGLASYGSSFTNGDVIGVALNMDAGTITFYKNNTSQGQAFSGITGTAIPCVIGDGNASAAVNFGQQPFVYTPPSGFLALNTFNM